MTMLHARTAICTIALLVAPLCTISHAAAMLGADQGSGYSGRILEKVAKTWQAPQYPSDHSVRIQVRIDGNGEVLECTPVQSSNLALLDKSACDAVREIKKYPLPPYGMPIDVYLTFWTGLPAVSNLNPEPGKLASAAQASRNEQQAANSTAAALALARAAEARAAAANKGAAKSSPAPTQVSPGTSLAPRGAPPATPATTVTTAPSGDAGKGVTGSSAKASAKAKPTKGANTATLATDASDRATVLITKAPAASKEAAPAKGSSPSKATVPAQKSSPSADNKDAASPPAARTSAPSGQQTASADSTSGGRVIIPTPVSDASKTARPLGNLVGAKAEEPTASEGRYARQVRWTIREAMLIPAELPQGEYTFTIYVRLSETGQITKSDMTYSSGNPLMDKYAMRGITRVKEIPPPPTKKLHDLHLTFVVQRS